MTSAAVQEKVEKLLGQFHPIYGRKMFGGVGLYSAESGNIFAVISSRDVLYFKVDAHNRRDYEDIEMEQFHKMPYFKVPEEVLSDDEALRVWMQKSLDVAARAKKKKKPKKTAKK